VRTHVDIEELIGKSFDEITEEWTSVPVTVCLTPEDLEREIDTCFDVTDWESFDILWSEESKRWIAVRRTGERREFERLWDALEWCLSARIEKVVINEDSICSYTMFVKLRDLGYWVEVYADWSGDEEEALDEEDIDWTDDLLE